MSVRSRPTTTKDSAVVSRATLKRQRGAIERYSAWVILLVSFLGTIAAFAGGWPQLIASLAIWEPPYAAIVGGIAIQAALTFLQWWYYDLRLVSIPARIADAVLTALGYGPLVVGALEAALAARGVGEPTIPAWVIVGIASYALAWYPESRLVE